MRNILALYSAPELGQCKQIKQVKYCSLLYKTENNNVAEREMTCFLTYK